tara:strand:- start:1142 stop:3535 length:2394 start_codon:yes stop_codon:yes gene_type:complete
MNKILLSVLLTIIAFNYKAQLVVNTGTMTPTQYVQNVLVGNGVTVSNVTFSGQSSQIGDFDSQNANVGLVSGLTLSTGAVTSAIGPNNNDGSNYEAYGGANDGDLQSLSGVSMKDAAVLEFDFVPSGDSIRFNYVFGSEEYMEFVGFGWNDAFGFFLSGPGISGPYSNNSINLAKLPGTNTAVSIEDVNANTNSGFYNNNGNGSNAPFNSDPQYIQYDGLTVSLVAQAQVQCNQTYHIKIAIADGGDDQYNSGVFLEGGSFSSNDIIIDIGVPTLDILNGMPVVIEGCSEAVISFIRADVTDSLTVHFGIGGDAVNGGVNGDYAFIPDSVTFPVGVDSVAIVINPFIDGPDDFGQDTVTISYTTINACGDTTYTEGSFIILDVPNLVVVAQDTSICVSPNVTINAEAFGAVAPFTYNWVDSTNDTIQTDVISGASSLTVSGLLSSTYYVYVTDSCNLVTTVDTVNIYVDNNQASISTSGDTTLYCAGQTISLEAFPTDSISIYDYSWSNGGSTSIISVNPAATITYYVTATNLCNASTDIDTINVIVDYTPVEIVSTTNDTILECLGINYNLDLYSIVQNGTQPYSFQWSGGGTSSDSLFQTTVNSPTTFYLDITDACNLHALDTVEVTFAPYTPITLITPNLDSVCSGEDAGLSVRVLDGFSPYSYLWETGELGGAIQYTTSTLGLVEIDVYVTDKCLNTDTATVEVPVKLCEVQPMNVLTPNGDKMNDELVFRYLENYDNSRLVVYNRWGKSVFESSNYKNDWSATDLSTGTYFYVLEVGDAKSTIIKGTLTIFN